MKFIFLVLLFIQIKGQEWCWTAPNLQVKVETNKLGLNWGICQKQEQMMNDLLKYEITIHLLTVDGYRGVSGPFFMEMSSDEMQGQEFMLSDQEFEGEVFKRSFDLPLRGDINEVVIRTEECLFGCEKIEIQQGYKNWEFNCNGVLNKKQKIMEMKSEDLVQYQIELYPDKNYQSDQPIYIQLIGQNNETNYQVLNFYKGINDWLRVYLKEYDDERYRLQQFKESNYKFQKLIIAKQNEESIEFKNKFDQKIDCPYNCIIEVLKNGNNNKQEEEEQEIDINKIDSSQFNGQFMNQLEKDKLIVLDCNQDAQTLFDEQQFLSKNVNFELKIGMCPSNCHKKTKVIGRSLHHQTSSICGSAIADGAMPKHGGVIGIAKVIGLNEYKKDKKKNGIKIGHGNESPFSFFTYKIENIDFSKSDIRIINHEGKIDYEGRVEIRVNGKWGTISKTGTSQNVARIFCKTLNYKEGELIEDSCDSYKDQDYCGFQGQPIHYDHYDCDSSIENINECQRHASSQKDHQLDILIKCSNQVIQQNEDGDIRLMGINNMLSMENKGRVQMFYKNKWSTICNRGWTDKSAKVACKQLKFKTGRAIGKANQYKACIIDNEDYCEIKGNQLIMEGLKCKGNEQSLLDCGGLYNTLCDIEQSAMVECQGEQKIDQIEITKRPMLGVLPLPNPYLIKCSQKLDINNFKGDPGSIYLVECPENCKEDESKIIGSGVYSEESSICKAAIHSGVLQNKGGMITVIVTYGQYNYISSTNREITSFDMGWSRRAFLISQVNSYHKLLSTQRYDLPFKSNQVSFLETDELVFKWINLQKIKFDKNTQIEDIQPNEDLRQIQSFTIFMQFQIDKYKGQIELLGHSQCNCWGIIINDDGIQFGEKCSQNIINFGYNLSLKKKHDIIISYDKISKLLKFYINGKLHYDQQQKFNFECQSDNINIGYNKILDDNKLIGQINYIRVYNRAISNIQDYLQKFKDESKVTKKQAQYTIDKRLCINLCSNDTLPGQKGAQDPPKFAQINDQQSEGQEGLDQVDPQEIIDQMKKNLPSSQSKSLQCDDDALLLQEQIGKQIRVYCPKGCSKNHKFVIGTQIYHPESSICKAAIHDGKIEDELGGDVIVEIQNPITKYQQSFYNNIKSQSISVNSINYSFILKQAQNVYQLTCIQTANDPLFQNQISININCPENCSKIQQNIFGVKIYSDESSVCQSAIHSGVINDLGGNAIIIFQKAKLQYEASTNEQVKSQQKQNQNGSGRSFSILGDNTQNIGYFKTIKTTNIFEDWYKEDNDQDSNWQYQLLFDRYVIIQKNDLNTVSKLFKKNYESSSALIKFNIYFNQQVQNIGIYFRYYDEQNYYLLKIDKENIMTLIKNSNGQISELKYIKMNFDPKIWYRFFLVSDKDTIKLNMQKHYERHIPQIFELNDSDVQRGQFVISTNGQVIFDGIQITKYDKRQGIMDQKSQNNRLWDKCLIPSTLKHREQICKQSYKSLKNNKCKIIFNYCELCCTKLIPRIEKIIHYSCLKTCIKANKQRENEIANQLKINNEDDYIPKQGDKVDFAKKNTNKFIEGVISKIKQINNNKYEVQIKYNDDEFLKETIIYPNVRIQKCGVVIKKRKDCD